MSRYVVKCGTDGHMLYGHNRGLWEEADVPALKAAIANASVIAAASRAWRRVVITPAMAEHPFGVETRLSILIHAVNVSPFFEDHDGHDLAVHDEQGNPR